MSVQAGHMQPLTPTHFDRPSVQDQKPNAQDQKPNAQNRKPNAQDHKPNAPDRKPIGDDRAMAIESDLRSLMPPPPPRPKTGNAPPPHQNNPAAHQSGQHNFHGVKKQELEGKTWDLGAALNPTRFVMTAVTNGSLVGMDVESGSDRDLTPRSTPRSTPTTTTTTEDSYTVSSHQRMNSGGAVGKVEEEIAETERGLERVRQNLARLKTFVGDLPNQVETLTQQIQALEKKKSTDVRGRSDLPLYHRIMAVQNYLKARRSIILAKVEEKVLVDRIRQMSEYFQQIPNTEKNDRSLMEAWNAMFDVHAIVPKPLAKDHCHDCKKPLIFIRKQAQMQCIFCAVMTEHLVPIGHANAWMRTNVHAQPENKRIKAVLAKLNQFLMGTPAIRDEIILRVRHHFRSRSHIPSEAPASVAAVTATLVALKYQDYVPYATKIATRVNGHEMCELTSEQISTCISMLKIAQFAHGMLSSCGKLISKHFFTNQAMNQIVIIQNLPPAIAAAFPIQTTKRLMKEQMIWWKQLLHYLNQIDTVHKWT